MLTKGLSLVTVFLVFSRSLASFTLSREEDEEALRVPSGRPRELRPLATLLMMENYKRPLRRSRSPDP